MIIYYSGFEHYVKMSSISNGYILQSFKKLFITLTQDYCDTLAVIQKFKKYSKTSAIFFPVKDFKANGANYKKRDKFPGQKFSRSQVFPVIL